MFWVSQCNGDVKTACRLCFLHRWNCMPFGLLECLVIFRWFSLTISWNLSSMLEIIGLVKLFFFFVVVLFIYVVSNILRCLQVLDSIAASHHQDFLVLLEHHCLYSSLAKLSQLVELFFKISIFHFFKSFYYVSNVQKMQCNKCATHQGHGYASSTCTSK